jgi:hypothetical protein
MSFLSPGLFAFLIPLAFLPVVIHLLNKGFPRHFEFPTVELIVQTLAQRSKIHKWRHWVLLLVRTICLLLLMLAFLLPNWRRFGADPGHQTSRRVLLVVDHSLSMEQTGDGPTSRDRAVHEGLKLIDSLSARDSVNVVLMEPTPTTCFLTFSTDHNEAKRFLSHLKPGLGRGDLNAANGLAARLLAKVDAASEVYYISDFQRKNWANANFTGLPAKAKLFFVDVAPTHNGNHAVLDARFAENQVLAGDALALEVSVGNYSPEPFEGRLTVKIDKAQSLDQQISVAAWSEAKLTVPVTAGGPGLHLCEVRLPADALEQDNRYCLTYAVQEKAEVLIVSDGPADRRSGAYFLKTALNPFENEAGSLLPRVIASSELTSSRLAGVRKMFFTQAGRLSPEACEAVGAFLFRGGGLVYFLDGPEEKQNIAALEERLGANTMPMRLARHRSATNVVAGAQQIARGDFKSRFLRLFQGSARQNLSLLEFFDYYQAGATSAGGVLLAYADETPAMAEVHHGMGTLLLLNFSASEISSNLARQRVFPAWMQDLVKALSVESPPPAGYTLGETLHTEIWRNEVSLDFHSPSGAVVTGKKELAGERCALTFTPSELGFYTIGSQRPVYAFGINPSADEADLRPIDKDVLPKEFASGHEAHFVAGGEDYDDLAKGRPLFQWFVLGALVFLMLESGFQLLIGRKKVARA